MDWTISASSGRLHKHPYWNWRYSGSNIKSCFPFGHTARITGLDQQFFPALYLRLFCILKLQYHIVQNRYQKKAKYYLNTMSWVLLALEHNWFLKLGQVCFANEARHNIFSFTGHWPNLGNNRIPDKLWWQILEYLLKHAYRNKVLTKHLLSNVDNP